ncbi:hypothetical protein EYF80_002432 [Liparis tanakae]|uniref:Uncharacterized protein n=1 Tax=Liparis tanakae TaxID=230148 RepID=A0A4Z2JAU3_9TELE|nr:hypothetical protein EYF80_002432 [Liparis tanakae]
MAEGGEGEDEIQFLRTMFEAAISASQEVDSAARPMHTLHMHLAAPLESQWSTMWTAAAPQKAKLRDERMARCDQCSVNASRK